MGGTCPKATGYGGPVTVVTGDGEHAAPEHAPFDAIIMTAAHGTPGSLD